jgi:phosphoglycolate phosphatase-like HAD superfamily hydrolase
MPVKAVIFDYKTLILQQGSAGPARELLEWLHAQGLRWCMFSTESITPAQKSLLATLGYPSPAACISKIDIPSGKKRGSPDWVDAATRLLVVARHELLYVGCTVLDWRTAINSGVLYLHALWAAPMPAGTTSLTVPSPQGVRDILETFLLGRPRWSHSLDGEGWRLRSLLPAGAGYLHVRQDHQDQR